MAIKIPLITEFDGGGIDKAVREFRQLETAGEKAQFAIKKAAIPAAAALGGLAIAGAAAAKAAMEDQRSSAELARTLEASTKATDAQVAATEDLITKMTLATGVADTDLRNALATLARGTGDVTKAQDLLNLALDISAATGKDLTSVSEALSKGYNGQYLALNKLDPTLKAVIKEGGDFADVGDRLAETFSGAAANAANTAEGQFKRMSVAISETQESIGAALLPIVQALLPLLQSLATFVQNNTGLVVGLAAAVGVMATAILGVNVALKAYAAAQTVATVASRLFDTTIKASTVGIWAAAIVAIGVALVTAYQKFEPFREAVDAVGAALKGAFMGVVEAIKTAVNIYVGIYKGLFNGIADAWNNTVGRLSFKIPGWVPGIGGFGFDVPNIPKLADGGIVTSPTLALIGEAGPEAVIPLDRMGSGGGTNVVINVNGGDPNAVVAALRRYMQVNGSVPIRTTAA